MNISLPPAQIPVNNYPAANTIATIASETPAPNEFIIVQGLHVSLAAGATGGGPVQWTLRDGVAGTIKLTGDLSAGVSDSSGTTLTGLNIPMTRGNPAVLAFEAAGGATTQEAVSLIYSRELANG